MTPDEYIGNIKWAAQNFDEIARGSIMRVGLEFFKERFIAAWNNSETIKGTNIAGVEFFATGQYSKDFKIFRGHTDTLNLSNAEGNPRSFRKAMYFADEGGEFLIRSNAQYKGQFYGQDVVDNFLESGIDIFEYENANESEADNFRAAFIDLMQFDL